MTSWCDAMPAARMEVSPSRCMSLTLQCNLQADFEKRVNPNDKAQAALLEEMRAHVKKVKQRQFPTFAQMHLEEESFHNVCFCAA